MGLSLAVHSIVWKVMVKSCSNGTVYEYMNAVYEDGQTLAQVAHEGCLIYTPGGIQHFTWQDHRLI